VEERRARVSERPSSVPLNPGEVIVMKDVAVSVKHMKCPSWEERIYRTYERVHKYHYVHLSDVRLIVEVVPPLLIPLEVIEGCAQARCTAEATAVEIADPEKL